MRGVANHPGCLKKMFLTKQNNYGFHVVRLHINGQPTNIVVDDRVPVTEGGSLIFARPQGDNLWPLILEKAWSKLNPRYGSAEQNLPNEVL